MTVQLHINKKADPRKRSSPHLKRAKSFYFTGGQGAPEDVVPGVAALLPVDEVPEPAFAEAEVLEPAFAEP
jgi:hypothetical protein